MRPGKQSGKKDEAFGCGEKPKRLIDVCAQDRGQVSARDPHQHQAAKGIEFFYSLWHGLPAITCFETAQCLRCTPANHGTLCIAWPSDLA